jgi:hypothetical protein
MDLPPEYLFANFMPYDDARQNHRAIETQLQSKLGRPVVDDSSNCLKRTWDFGIFSIELHTFPPELQAPELTRPGSNRLHDANPRLRIASSVALKSAYAFVYPDGTLAGVAESVRALLAGGDVDSAFFVDSSIAKGWRRKWLPLRETRRNPMSLRGVLATGSLVAWRDDESHRIGLSGTMESLVFGRTSKTRLILVRLEPARGPGGSRLYVETEPSPDPSRPYNTRTMILAGETPETLDIITQRLSRLWTAVVVEDTALDD